MTTFSTMAASWSRWYSLYSPKNALMNNLKAMWMWNDVKNFVRQYGLTWNILVRTVPIPELTLKKYKNINTKF